MSRTHSRMLGRMGNQGPRSRLAIGMASVVAIVGSLVRLALAPSDLERGPADDAPVPIVQGSSDGNEFQPQQVVPAFPAIVEAPHLAGDTATPEVVAANELVLGIELGGQARAYPINMLTGPRREIINDELAGRRLAATW